MTPLLNVVHNLLYKSSQKCKFAKKINFSMKKCQNKLGTTFFYAALCGAGLQGLWIFSINLCLESLSEKNLKFLSNFPCLELLSQKTLIFYFSLSWITVWKEFPWIFFQFFPVWNEFEFFSIFHCLEFLSEKTLNPRVKRL